MVEKCSIYVHIPFCKARCGYCAFSSCTDVNLQSKYFEKLFSEIEYYRNSDVSIATIYVGGGTPSAVEPRYIDELFVKLRSNFNLSDVSEITVECNPESATEQFLTCLKRNGVNRLSFGLQSVNDATLKRIGRIHTYDRFVNALQLAQRLGFDNINADVIVGLPESVGEFYKTIDTVSALPLQHLSVYALELHEGTALYDLCKQQYDYTDDDLADMYDYACVKLSESGFSRYEISNFAKVGCECKHNLNYWTEGRYFAFGASACGFVDDTRYANPFGLKEYLNTPIDRLHADCDTLSQAEQANEFVMLGMRLTSGVSLSEFRCRYGDDFFEFFAESRRLVEQGFLQIDGDRIFVPQDKLYVVNSILCELLNF